MNGGTRGNRVSKWAMGADMLGLLEVLSGISTAGWKRADLSYVAHHEEYYAYPPLAGIPRVTEVS